MCCCTYRQMYEHTESIREKMQSNILTHTNAQFRLRLAAMFHPKKLYFTRNIVEIPGT